MGKRPHFFCENCGADVPLQAKRCPGCGRYFESVRCPACGFTGDESKFLKGCPSCGNLAPESRKVIPSIPASFPLWVYFVGAAILAGIFALLFFRFAWR